MVPKENAPRGQSFTATLHDITSKIYSLHTTEKSALIIKQKQFDDFMQSSQIESEIDRLKEQIKTFQETEAAFKLRVDHLYETLSKAEKNDRKMNMDYLEEEEEELKAVYEKVFKYYETFIQIRSPGFLRIVQKYCFDNTAKVQVKEIRFRKFAYKKVNGIVSKDPADRLPEKDTSTSVTSTFGFRGSFYWKKTKKRNVPRGRSWEAFVHCRKEHMKSEFKDTGYAEAQYQYFRGNIKCPKGLRMSNLLEFIEKVSDVMHLLPSITDHKSGDYKNLPDMPARNKPFSDFAKAQMLFKSLPPAVQEWYKATNLEQPVPLDPEAFARDIQYELDKHWKEKELENAGSQQKKGNNGQKNSGTNSHGQSKSTRDGGQPRSGGNSTQKRCDRCAKAKQAPHVIKSHNTAACTRFDEHGKPKGSRPRQTNAHSKGDEPDEVPRSRKSSRKRDRKTKKKKGSSKRKKKGKSKKRRKRTARYYSSSDSSESSDSSDSDSDSYSSESS